MKTIAAAKFKEQCLSLLDHVPPEGILVTKRGKPVARLIPAELPLGRQLIGSLKGKLRITRKGDKLFSAGAWKTPRFSAKAE
jgi:prevent-host-death family protein